MAQAARHHTGEQLPAMDLTMPPTPCPATGVAIGAPEAVGLSAVICTRNRTAQLARALESLLDQDARPSEILVIDNAPSDDATRRLLRRWAMSHATVRYMEEPAQGLNFARNRALREARQDIVAFLDDDAVADRGWCRTLTEALLRHPRAAVCTGRVEALAPSTDAQRLFEANGGFSRGVARILLPSDARRPLHGRPAPLIAWAVSIGNGASFAVRRHTVRAMGGFDEALDLGAALPGGGDLDLFWRALRAGHELVYEPTALAWHEHRRTFNEMVEQLAGHQRALIAFLCKSAASTRGAARLPVLAFLAWRLVKPGSRLLLRLVGQDPLPAAALRRMWTQSVRGLGAYPAARRLAARRAAGQATETA